MFLLTTAILQARSARGLAPDASSRRGLIMELLCDLSVAVGAGMTLAEGHQNGVLRVGLWLVPPSLLAASAASAVASLLAWRLGTESTTRHKIRWLRPSLAAMVIAFLVALR